MHSLADGVNELASTNIIRYYVPCILVRFSFALDTTVDLASLKWNPSHFLCVVFAHSRA